MKKIKLVHTGENVYINKSLERKIMRILRERASEKEQKKKRDNET